MTHKPQDTGSVAALVLVLCEIMEAVVAARAGLIGKYLIAKPVRFWLTRLCKDLQTLADEADARVAELARAPTPEVTPEPEACDTDTADIGTADIGTAEVETAVIATAEPKIAETATHRSRRTIRPAPSCAEGAIEPSCAPQLRLRSAPVFPAPMPSCGPSATSAHRYNIPPPNPLHFQKTRICDSAFARPNRSARVTYVTQAASFPEAPRE